MNLDREMQLFLDALERSGEERARFVAAIEDDALRENVRELLATHDDRETAPLPEIAAPDAGHAEKRTLEGSQIDDYRILERIGEGGMGVVYLAEQARPKRRVALKIVHAAASRETLRRFEHEAEILARLEHPGIARLYDTGVAATEFGELPYLALEWVDGVPLDQYLLREAPGAGLDARLELLIAICEALAFAHAQGVIHRDLKPGNILVDAQGRPKILDFGIARIMDEAPAQTLATRTGQMLGTLSYMSPEQLAGRTHEIDTRSDIYALGIVAFEVLAGKLPIDVSGLSITRAIHELVDRDPRRLSRVDARLRGDIDIVVAKALRKERAERYQSVPEFASDLRRILAHEPIAARAPSAAYQLRKLVRRNRVAFASFAIVALALAAGLVLAVRGRDQAEVARAELARALEKEQQASRAANEASEVARERAASMRNVANYMAELLQIASPANGAERTIDLDQLIVAIGDEGRDNVIATDPLAAGLMLFNIAAIHADWGDGSRAVKLVQLARERLEESALATDVDRVALERLSYRAGRLAKRPVEELAACVARADALSPTLRGDDRVHQVMVTAMRADLAELRGEHREALELAARALEEAAAWERFPERELGAIHTTHGLAQFRLGRPADAAASYERARELYDAGDGTVVHRIHIRRLLSDCHDLLGRGQAAIASAREAMELARDARLQSEAGRAANKLAHAYAGAGEHAKAARTWDEAIELLAGGDARDAHLARLAPMHRAWSIALGDELGRGLREMKLAAKKIRSTYGAGSPYFAMALQRVARLAAKGPEAERRRALAQGERAAQIWEAQSENRHAEHARTLLFCARQAVREKRWEQAERHARAAVALYRELGDATRTLNASIELGSSLAMQERQGEALAVFDPVLRAPKTLALLGDEHFTVLLTWARGAGDTARERAWKRARARGAKAHAPTK